MKKSIRIGINTPHPHNNNLDVWVNNLVLNDFLNAVNKTDNYKLAFNEQGISYEIEQDNIIQKTVLLKSGCEQYNIDNFICAELPLKKVKTFLKRTAGKHDMIHIYKDTVDNLLVFANDNLSLKLKWVIQNERIS